MLHLLTIGSPLALGLTAIATLATALWRLLLGLTFLVLVCRADRGDLPAIARELSHCFSRQRGTLQPPHESSAR
jgi:hypothetical protein